MLFLIPLIIGLITCYGGKIHPDLSNPIQLLWNNAGDTTRYIFNFVLETKIDSDALLTIDFPTQYLGNLGITSCQAYEISNSSPIELACSVLNRRVTFSLGMITAGQKSIKILNVKNPNSVQGTGAFAIRT